jgi:hypothetical protein
MILDEKFKKMICDTLETKTVPGCVTDMISFTQMANRRVGGQFGLSNDQVATILLIARNQLKAETVIEVKKPEKKIDKIKEKPKPKAAATKDSKSLEEAKRIADVLGIEYPDDVDDETLNEMIERNS